MATGTGKLQRYFNTDQIEITTAGTYYVGVRMYTSSAPSSSYTVTIDYIGGGSAPVDDVDPVVDITDPVNDATVSGTIDISIEPSTAAGTNGSSPVVTIRGI